MSVLFRQPGDNRLLTVLLTLVVLMLPFAIVHQMINDATSDTSPLAVLNTLHDGETSSRGVTRITVVASYRLQDGTYCRRFTFRSDNGPWAGVLLRRHHLASTTAAAVPGRRG